MKQILGEQPQFIAIDFPETSTTARLTAQLEQAVNELDAQHDIVFYRSARRAAVSRSQRSRCKSRERSDHRHQPAASAGNGAGTRRVKAAKRFVCRRWSAGIAA
jgi:adenylate kinase family enzyme